MKPKRKLKSWVKIALFVIPIAVVIIQLFLVEAKIKDVYRRNSQTIITVEYNQQCRCYHE